MPKYLSEYNVKKTFTVGKLTEPQNAKLAIAGEALDIFVSTIFPCEIVEIVAIKGENTYFPLCR